MEIPIHEKTVFILRKGPGVLALFVVEVPSHSKTPVYKIRKYNYARLVVVAVVVVVVVLVVLVVVGWLTWVNFNPNMDK